jgi:hypothetical protein
LIETYGFTALFNIGGKKRHNWRMFVQFYKYGAILRIYHNTNVLADPSCNPIEIKKHNQIRIRIRNLYTEVAGYCRKFGTVLGQCTLP